MLAPHGIDSVQLVVDFDHLSGFRLRFGRSRDRHDEQFLDYPGQHEAIYKIVRLDEVHDYDGTDRNRVIPVVRDIVEEVSRVFGLSKASDETWNEHGILKYVKGLEDRR